jgi:enamine deaminase RidA (YjgF/YER057c/UK114 family)
MRAAFGFPLASALLVACIHVSGCVQEGKTLRAKQNETPTEGLPYRVFNPDTMPKPAGRYSQVAEVSGGKTVYISGQIPLDRSGSLVGKDDFRAQVQQVFENLKAAVESAGGDFHSVIKLNYYCAANVDTAAQIPVVREILDKYIDPAHPPTGTFLVVNRLARPDWLIEVEAVAVVKK